MTAEVVQTEVQTWAGDNPYFLLVVRPTSEIQRIDLDEHGWATTYKDWMRGRMRWYLVRKADEGVMFGIEVYPDDQPFVYTHHSTDITGPQAGTEWLAYGIGTKHQDGTRDGLWITQHGLVCNDRDVESLMRG